MPKLTLMHSGVKAAFSSRPVSTRGIRGEVMGWSLGSARRCDLFLRSVVFQDIEKQGLCGYAVTCTIADCPPSFAHWARVVKNFIQRMRQRGLNLSHHVTEWQLRGRFGGSAVPHLHCVFFFDDPQLVAWSDGFCDAQGAEALRVHWLEVADDFGPLLIAQHSEEVSDVHGWFRYLSKHAARGVAHYQREHQTLPKGWQKTGRMWGKSGEWPVWQAEGYISSKAFYAMRRFSNCYLISEARRHVRVSERRLSDARGFTQTKDGKHLLCIARGRVAYLKQRLRRSDPKIARLIPLSDWVPSPVLVRWLEVVCVCDERMHPETGEMVRHYRMIGETVGHFDSPKSFS